MKKVILSLGILWWAVLGVGMTVNAVERNPLVLTWNPGSLWAMADMQGMKADKDGNLVVAGEMLESTGSQFIHIRQLSKDGDVQWAVKEQVPSSAEPWVQSMDVGPDGGVVIMGIGGVTKWDSKGNLAWKSGDFAGEDMVIDNVGNVLVAGFSDAQPSLVKISPSGSIEWIKLGVPSLGEPHFHGLSRKLEINQLGEIYVGSANVCRISNGRDYYEDWISKFDTDGSHIWDYLLSGCGNTLHQEIFGLHPLPNGGAIVVHNRKNYTNRPIVRQLDGNGHSTGTHYWAWAEISTLDRAGNLFGSMGHPLASVIETSKFSPEGKLLWSRQFAGAYRERFARAMVVSKDQSMIIVAGLVARLAYDVVVLAYDSETGRELWSRAWPGYGDDEVRSVLTDDAGNVFVAGTTRNSMWGKDLFLLKYPAIHYNSNAPVAVDRYDLALAFTASPGAKLEIQGSTNLVDWLDLGTTQADSEGVARYRDTNVLKTLPQRYYRSRRE